ncbi:DUF4198 domain-containing protein [Herminiimonas arsenitoxidans]|uniref:DUF4198 domain-containing protein n=1 Tax=Herminiimonas arsenitoxidans TaxID=1809410 RepID=UPI0009708BEE|nr:DUF4198 domain-containing protein [Herminiimonas arsenitoxidans]
MKRRLALLPLMTALMFAGAAHAHQIWLEQTPKAASLYFGEFDRNLRETSPGLLDKITQASATLSSDKGEKVLAFTRKDSALVLPGHAGKNESIFTEDVDFPVSEYKNGDVTVRSARILGARLVTSNAVQAPKLTLDLVTTGKQGEFKVYYKGQPQAKVKVGLIAQSGWTREASTNEQGVVKFDLPWQGTYVLEVRYVDKTPGERAGKPYDFTNFMTTLSLSQTTGIKALPTTPAETPNK